MHPRAWSIGWTVTGTVAAVLVGLVAAQPLLSAFLLAAPLFAPAAIPRSWWAWRWSVPLALLAALTAAHPPIIQAWIDARSSHGVLAWGPALAKGWALAGLGLCLTGLAVRWWRFCHLPIARGLGVFFILVTYPLVTGPLPLIYRQQVTYAEEGHPDGTRWTVHTRDGLRLDTLLLPALPAGAEPKGVVVFVHGVGRWKEFFRDHFAMIRAEGWSVLCYDLRGHGRSSVAPTTYGPREVEDLETIWGEARRLAQGRPIAVYGVSLGAAITLQGAHRLEGCAAVAAESSFAELEPLLERAVPFAPVRWVALGMCRIGLGWSPAEVRPVDAPILREGPPLLLGATELDRTVPISHHGQLVGRAPRAATFVSTTVKHAGLVHDAAWRAALGDLLRRVATSPAVGH